MIPPYEYGKAIDQIINVEFPWYIKFLEECFDFKRRGFQLIYSGRIPDSLPVIVYESKVCRVRFIWSPPEHQYIYSENIVITYGRLHAPIFQSRMEWNGEECYCWHSCHQTLDFLDGLTPLESHKKTRGFWRDFFDANKDKEWREAEYYARREAAIWEHYGQRLLDIFDLNRPDLWEQYTNFLKERYNIVERTYVDPFPDSKVC
jgi:hypothetical protein